MRTITIKTGSGTQTYQSSAENLAELANDTGVSFTDQSVIAKEARLMLDDTSQPLPQGDITLVVSPAKMKAGA
jgi:hypothetical protein|tara:strand:+ start:575 stop:793 length:219 start_codon:yes stop_codon:yes gene_type:complete